MEYTKAPILRALSMLSEST